MTMVTVPIVAPRALALVGALFSSARDYVNGDYDNRDCPQIAKKGSPL